MNQTTNKKLIRFHRWVSSLDKYIDNQFRKKSGLAGFIVGPICFIFFTVISMQFEDFFLKYYPSILVASFPVTYGFVKINHFGWQVDRQAHLQGANYCNRENLYRIGDDGWVKTRIKEHYTCTICNFIGSFLMSWCASIILGLVVVKVLRYF